MKKVSLFAFVLSATAASWASAEVSTQLSNCPKAFQGFHLGGNIGYGIGRGKQRIRDSQIETGGVTPGTTVNSIHNTLGVNGVDGGIGTGYLHRFGHWGLGIAFDANWSNSSGKVRGIQSNTSAAGSRAVEGLVGHARLKNSLDLYAKLGYVLCGEQVMPFVALGWENASWRQKAVRFNVVPTGSAPIPTFRASHSKRLNAFLWKAGVDFLATKHVVVGFEYTGTDANRKRFSRTTTRNLSAGGTVTETLTGSFKPQYNKFALTARVVY